MSGLDLTYLTTNVSSDPEFIQEILTVFLNALPNDKGDLDNAIREENTENIKRAAHKLKSSFRSLGFTEASTQLEALEHLARDQAEITSIKSVMHEFDSIFPQMVEEVELYLKTH